METVLLELGQVVRVHDREACIGTWCAIHSPMPGPWEMWPRWWRDDRGIMERICPCGIGHPVAEMYEWTHSIGHDWKLVHGCCDQHQCGPFLAIDDKTEIIPVVEDNQIQALDVQKQILDLLIDLWPENSRATVKLGPVEWGRLRHTLLDALAALEEKQ